MTDTHAINREVDPAAAVAPQGVSGPPQDAGAIMARWSAKALLATAGVLLVGGAIWYARAATVPLIVAALISTQVVPLVAWAVRRGVPRALAVAASLVGVVAAIAGLAWVFTDSLFGNLGGVGQDVSAGADEVVVWLGDHQTWIADNEAAIRDFLRSVLPAAKDAAAGLLGGALGGLSLAASMVSGIMLAIVFLLYFLSGGEAVWGWTRERFRPERQARVDAVGVAAWRAAGGYVRGIALVALIDTVVITAGMLVLGTPHVGTLALLTFASLFVPILGAWVSGAVIVLVTLAEHGIEIALVMAVVILVAQQIDGMFVTPLVYQQTVSLHPIVTLTAVIVGSQLLGIVGAFLAVPMVAVAWAIYKELERSAPG